MSKINDGGPAFPVAQTLSSGGVPIDGGWGGMALRDFFAGIAMHAIIMDLHKVTASIAKEYGQQPKECVADMAYQAADAMLAERAKVSS